MLPLKQADDENLAHRVCTWSSIKQKEMVDKREGTRKVIYKQSRVFRCISFIVESLKLRSPFGITKNKTNQFLSVLVVLPTT